VVAPASICVEGGIPPLSTGALSDWAKAANEVADKIPANASAVMFGFIMVSLLFR
jgi:hypothetical protein